MMICFPLCLQTPFPFPAPSIFGPGGFGFAAGNAQQQANSKCQLVQPGALQPVVAIASNPQWTCGVIVDGQLSCQQGKQQRTFHIEYRYKCRSGTFPIQFCLSSAQCAGCTLGESK
jgi:hypothetical protein